MYINIFILYCYINYVMKHFKKAFALVEALIVTLILIILLLSLSFRVKEIQIKSRNAERIKWINIIAKNLENEITTNLQTKDKLDKLAKLNYQYR